MKKSDLISGKHIVELRDGSRVLVAGNFLPDIDGNGYIFLTSFGNDLKHVDSELGAELDICKVYEIIEHMGFPQLAENMDTACKLVWERKPELSDAERVILKNADKIYKYIARDKNSSLFLYSKEISKFADEWCFDGDKGIVGNHSNFSLFNHLFKMVKWEDEEPTLISDLLGE